MTWFTVPIGRGQRALRFGLVCAAAWLAGCAAPAQHTTLLTLPPRLAPAPETALNPAQVLQVARLSIPEYLTARSARYRADDNTLMPWPATVWAERLEVALTRDLASALRQRLPGWQVCDELCPLPPSHRLQVTLSALEHQRSSRTLQAQARWSWQTIGPQAAAPTTGQRSGTITGLADSPQAGAAAMAAWMDQLADGIAGR